MNRPLDKTNLGFLGPNFQYKLVKQFMEEPEFFQSIYSVVEQNTFTELLLKQFVGVLKDYYYSTSIIPSYETMLVLLKQKARTENEVEEWEELVKNLKELSPEGSTVIEETATKFFMQQNMIKVANDILKKTQDGDFDHYEECQKMMEDALNVGKENDLGFNPYDLEEEVLHPNSDIPIATGISHIDDKLNGGLYKGHVGVIIGPPGFGKTTYSTAVASYASTCANDLNGHKGWKVVQICFEDDARALAKKHFSRITQIDAKDINKADNIEEARQLLDEFSGKELFKENLIVKKFKTNTACVEDIKSYIKRLINKGFRPDMVILDYFECLKLIRKDRSETKWDLQENTMRQLEVLAEEFNIALWVMTQGGRGSLGSEIVTLDQSSGSISKVQIGHVILSIARDIEDQENNIATIALLKNRQGGSGNIFKDIKFNNGTCTISCDEVEVFNNALLYEDAIQKENEATVNNYAKQLRDEKRASKAENTTTEEAPKEEKIVENPAVNKEFEKEPVKYEESVPEETSKPDPVVIRKPVTEPTFKLEIAKPEAVTSPIEEIETLNQDLCIQEDEFISLGMS